MMSAIGVYEVVNYSQSEDAIISEIVKKTGGKMFHIFDAVSQYLQFSIPMFAAIEGADKWFTSTNDWYGESAAA